MAGQGADGEQPLLQSRDGGVLTLTLNRPHRRNAIDSRMWAAFGEALATAADDPQVRALVITGAGGAFCAGLDLAGAGDGGHPLDVSGRGPGSHPLEEMRRANELALRLHDLPIPVVAKVTGVAVGAGWNLALGCDLVVASPQARFSQIFVHRGVSVDFGGSWLLPKLVGLQQAKRLVLLGEMLDADEAHRLGLVTWVVADDEVDGFTAELARRLAAGPPVATAQSKALLNEGADRSLREALAGEARAQTVNFATADSREGFTAFLDKAEPAFTGEWAVK